MKHIITQIKSNRNHAILSKFELGPSTTQIIPGPFVSLWLGRLDLYEVETTQGSFGAKMTLIRRHFTSHPLGTEWLVIFFFEKSKSKLNHRRNVTLFIDSSSARFVAIICGAPTRRAGEMSMKKFNYMYYRRLWA